MNGLQAVKVFYFFLKIFFGLLSERESLSQHAAKQLLRDMIYEPWLYSQL